MAKQAEGLVPAKQRVHWVDCTKAIGSLLVIVGHSHLEVEGLRGLIYSFHMPLFFLLSGATFHFSKNSTEFLVRAQKTFRHLMLPVIVIFLISTAVNALRTPPQVFSSWDGVLEYARSVILQASFASGIEVSVFSAEVPALGMPWFLVTLALGRILFDYLHLRMGQRKFVISCVVLSFIGVIVGKVQYLPLSFDIVLVLPLLLYIGGCLIRLAIEKASLRKTIVYGGIWAALTLGIYLFTDEYLEMARRSYPLYPVSMVGAVFGTLMTAEFSAFLVEKVKPISRPLVYIGENSLYLLYVHMFDVSFLGRLWNITEIQYINVFLRIVVDLAIFGLLMAARKGIRCLRERT